MLLIEKKALHINLVYSKYILKKASNHNSVHLIKTALKHSKNSVVIAEFRSFSTVKIHKRNLLLL